MPIILKRRTIEETPSIPSPSNQIIIKRRTVEETPPINRLVSLASKGVSSVAEKALPIRPKLQEGTLFPETAFTDYDKWMESQRNVIKKRVLSAQPGANYYGNIARELGGQALDVLADPKWIIASGMMGAAGDWTLNKAIANPTFRAFAEKHLPKLLEGKLDPIKYQEWLKKWSPLSSRGTQEKALVPVEGAGFTLKPTGVGKVAPEGLAFQKQKITPEAKTITPKYAENLNISRLPENIRKPVAEVIAEKPVVGKSPHITHEQLIRKASELKDTPTVKHLLSKEEGTFAAEILKARQGDVITINQILSKDLGELSQVIKEEMIAPVSRLRRIGSELGRALEQQKITPFQKQNIIRKIIAKKNAIDKDPLFKGSEAGKFLKSRLDDLAKEIIGEKITPSTIDKAYFAWLNSILSDPRTHMVNVGSNTLFALGKLPERFVAAMMDLPLTGLGKLGVKRIGKIPLTGQKQVFFGEVPAMIKGLLKRGVKSPQAIGSKFEQVQLYAGDKYLPTGWLKQEDVWAKNVVGRMEMFAKLYRVKAMGKKGLVGLQDIKQEQLYRTFQNEPGKIAKSLMSIRNELPLVRWIIPFVKTPANIIDAAVERTPLGIVALGKAQTQRELSERLAFLGIGSSMAAWAGVQYLKGNITGDAPTDPAERDAFYAQGKQPNAIRLFGYWIPFERVEPVGTALALVVNAMQDYKTSDKEIPAEKVMDSVGGLAQTATNKTYLQGLTNLMKAMSDPEIYGPKWAEAIVSGMATPGLLNFIAQLKDPYFREARGVGAKIKSRVPVVSKEVTPKLTVFGEKIERKTPFLPIRVSKEKDNLVRKELRNLGVTVGFPSRTVGKQKLTSDQYAKMLEEAGQEAYKALERMFQFPEWGTLSQSEKEKEIDAVVRESREFPREKMAMSILLNGIKEAKTDKELREFLKKMKEAKVLTQERFNTLWDKGLVK